MFIFTEWTFLKIATFLLRYLKNKFKKKIWVFRNKLPSKMRRVDKMGHVFKKKETFKCTDWSNTILRTHPWNKILSHIIRDAWSLQMTAGWKLVVSEWMGKREREREIVLVYCLASFQLLVHDAPQWNGSVSQLSVKEIHPVRVVSDNYWTLPSG